MVCPFPYRGMILTSSLPYQVGTHADSMIAEAVVKGAQGFDRDLAWEAVWMDVSIPPKDDGSVM
jgi:hypothetical protein